MPILIAVLALLLGLIHGTYANADPVTTDTSATATPPTVLEKIIVSGEQPGPGLWKVTKGDHVLWIVGTQTPVQKNMTWRAKGVTALVADAQEILSEPGASVTAKKIGYFTTLTLLPSLMDARKNPGGATLKEVVPAEL